MELEQASISNNNMQKNISFQFYFTLYCEREFDVSMLSTLLGIQSNKEWVKNSNHPKPLYRNESFWKVSSSEIFTLSFEEDFMNFINSFYAKSNLITDVIEKFNLNCKIDVVIKIYSGNIMPGISLSQEILNLLSKWNCSIDFDIYDFRNPVNG